MKNVFIKDVISKRISGEWGVDPTSDKRVKVIRTTNFTNTGKINFSNVVEREIAESKVNEKRLQVGDIIIEKSGGSPTQPVGRVVFFDNIDDAIFLCNNFTSILRPSKDIFPKYLFYCLYYLHLKNVTLNYQNKTTGIINLQLERYINSVKISIPSYEEQINIAGRLDKINELLQKRKQSIILLDNYSKSIFIKMFGDPEKNSKTWEVSSIGEQCDVKGGKRIPKGSKLIKESTGFPYIKAGNIKDGKISTKNLEYLTPELRNKIANYTVNKGDVCITVVGVNIGDIGIVPEELHMANLTENANKLLIKDANKIKNMYLSYYLMTDYIQNILTSSIRSSGVPKLALFRIEQIKLLLPTIDLQIRFSKIVENIDFLKKLMKSQLSEIENQYQSLMQKSFNIYN